MPTDHAASPCAQLAHSREAIAQWLKTHPAPPPIDAENNPSVGPTSTHVLLGLLLLAIAESVLKHSAKLPISTSKFPSMQDATELVKTYTRQHPIWMLGLAIIAGAAMTASRPWRWFTHQKTWFALLSQLVVVGVTHAFNHHAKNKTSQ